MTTDIINHREVSVLAPLTPVASTRTGITSARADNRTNGKKSKKAKRPENIKLEFKPDSTTSLFDVLEQHAREKDGWECSMSATLALLKQAHNMIEEAEDRIFHQEQRIRELEKVSTTDELTSLLNRRGFYDAFTGELDRCSRGLVKGGLLVLIDLDNFKSINDTFGHAAGDAALRLVGRTLKNEIRAMDAVARLGGDEFVLLLSHTTKRDAAARAQNLGWKLNNLSLAWYGDEIPVRASLGLKSFAAGDKADMIFNAADAGLYEQKEARRQSGERSERMNTSPSHQPAEEQPLCV